MHDPSSLGRAEAEAAAERIKGMARRTPLIRLSHDGSTEIWLKLENLQPIRSFKIRGAANAMLAVDAADLADGVWAASAGNMAQGVAYCARELGVSCAVVVPEGAPQAKIDAIEALGAQICYAPFDDWFRIYASREYPGMKGRFVHAFSDPLVMAGNATIGLELLEDLEDFDAVVIPYGGGGLSCGIAALLRQVAPDIALWAAEVDTAAPLAAAFDAGRPVPIDHERTFIDGIGGPVLFDEMWAMARQVLEGAMVSSVAEIRRAIRYLVKNAAILAGRVTTRAGDPARRIVCVVSGGNIDTKILSEILNGQD
ncbi:MAG: pyridoxal-phosphate dependent enzyme [Acidobacteria bacterium]|nr:pyridoxal-phosphate dependent enzyme [Acidobacteriota bacterium]